MIVTIRSRGLAMVRAAMMPGIAQAKLDKQRNERAARQSDAAHQPVEQERGARKVTRFLQQQDEDEQDHDLREEHHHAADARDQAVDDQALSPSLRAERCQPLRQAMRWRPRSRSSAIRPTRTPPERRGTERREQHRPMTGCSTTRSMRSLAVSRHDRIQAEPLQNAAHGLVGRLGVRGSVLRSRRRAPQTSRLVEERAQRIGAVCSDPDGRHHGHAELAASASASTSSRAALRYIGHVERDHAGTAQPLHRQHEPQAPPEVGRVDDAHHRVGPFLAFRAALQHVAGDALVRASADAGCRRRAGRAARQGLAIGVASRPSLRSTVTPA